MGRRWDRALAVTKFAAPALYVLGAALVWWDFQSANPDGLANVWLALYTLPFVLVGSGLLGAEFPYVPGGYYVAHGIYFWPAVAFLGLGLFGLFHGLHRITGSGRR